jgi:type IV pilus assembly protein PilM
MSPIGLDVGSRQVKAVQLLRSGSAWRLQAMASIPRSAPGPVGADEAKRIADVLDRQGFRSREIVLAVPSETLLATNLELPLRTPEMPFEQIAREEFARALKHDSHSFEFACWDLPAPARAAKATHVMAVGCATAQSEPVLESFAAARLSVVAVDVEACALARACAPLLAPPEQITAILDIGWQSARLSILHQATISYWRCLTGMGMEALHKSLAQQLDVPGEVVEHILQNGNALSRAADDDGPGNHARRAVLAHADALIGEITTSLSYAAHQYPDAAVSRVLMVGGGAEMQGLSDYFAAQLGMDVKLAAASDVVEAPGSGESGARAQMLLAIGLGQHSGD